MNTPRVPTARLGAYAAMAVPLAMAALPVYVHAPKLYGDDRGLALTTVGLVLLLARALDAVQDPWLGWWGDRVVGRGGSRNGFLVAAVALLGAGVLAIFHPPRGGPALLTAWLAGSLLVTYLGFSLGTINYFALGAELSADYHERTRITAARGAAGVAGVLAAAALPELLAGDGPAPEGLRRFALLYVPILLCFAAVTLFGVRPPAPAGAPGAPVPFSWRAISAPLRGVPFRWLLAVFVASGVASAIPAALILFYVQDVLARSDLSGLFLAVYFLFGALGMPLWVKASRRLGKKGAWMLGMVMSVVAFVWAFLLGEGDAVEFGIVCALSGLAYGAELAIPPSLLADVAAERDDAGEGLHFGFWQLTEKLNLALAAGFALPVLGLAGYQPGTPQPPLGNLSAMYALIPCMLKLGAIAVLWLAPLDRAVLSSSRPGDVTP